MPDDMLTTAEVAAVLELNPQTVYTYVSRGSFPAPDGYLGATPWWRPATVEEWQASRRAPGRPKKEA